MRVLHFALESCAESRAGTLAQTIPKPSLFPTYLKATPNPNQTTASTHSKFRQGVVVEFKVRIGPDQTQPAWDRGARLVNSVLSFDSQGPRWVSVFRHRSELFRDAKNLTGSTLKHGTFCTSCCHTWCQLD